MSSSVPGQTSVKNSDAPRTLFDRQGLTGEIIFRLVLMESVIKWHSSRQHNDHAKTAEDVVARFLAALCGWKVINLNTLKKNYPAADLGVPTEGIAIQVTVDGTAKKIRGTHEGAREHKLSTDFHTLIILFLMEKAPGDPRKSKTFTPCTEPQIKKWANPQLRDRLVAQPGEPPDLHLGRLRRCLAVLRDEMTSIHAIISPTREVPPHFLPWASIGQHFKGRETFLDSLHSTLAATGSSTVSGHTVRGDAGIGKTCAAVEYAWRQFFLHSGIFFITADSPDSLQANFAALGAPTVLNLPDHEGATLPQQTGAVLRWLKDHPGWLLIIDNADTRPALDSVLALLAQIPGGHVIITTRQDIALRGITALRMDCLDQDESIAYLREATAGARRSAPDDAAAERELADAMGGLPLGLSQAAAHIAYLGCTYRHYLNLRSTHIAKAHAWHDPAVMHYPVSLAVTYETSISQLTPGAQHLLRVLSWFAPDPIPHSIIEAPSAPENALEHFAELKSLSLVKLNEDGSAFTVHRLVQEITRQQQESSAPPGADRSANLHFAPPGEPHLEGRSATSRSDAPAPGAPGTHSTAPPALTAALAWLDDLVPADTDDVRTWPVIAPLAPHVQAAALSAAERGIPHPTARLLNQVGLFYFTKAQNKNAEPLMRRALSVDEESYGPSHPSVAIRLSNLAQLLKATNRLAEAESLTRRALAIDEESYGPAHPDVAIDLNNLAQLLQATNRLAEAEPLMTRVVEILENKGGDPFPNYSGALNNLAQLLQSTNRLAEAEPLMRRALAIDEESYGPSHPNVARDLNNLAQLLQDTNRPAEAEPLYRRALAIDEESYGPAHPMVAIRLNNLATLLDAMGRTGGALEMYRRVLDIFEKSFGKEHPNVAVALNNLADTLKNEGLTSEAEPLMRRALAIDEESYGPSHPKVARDLNNLATLLKATNRLAEAEPLMRRAVEIFEQSLGGAHPSTVTVLENLEILLTEMAGADKD